MTTYVASRRASDGSASSRSFDESLSLARALERLRGVQPNRENIMSNSGILREKRAIVFGGGGSIGSAVAKEFAAEGAEVFVAGRNRANVEDVAKQIKAAGGRAHAGVVDATEARAVDRYLDEVAGGGAIDVVFNAIGPRIQEYGNTKGAVELTPDQFMVPLETVVKAAFVGARAAARHMIKQRSGVILFVTGSPAKPHGPGTTAIGAAFGAVENLTKSLAHELSPAGVRVVCVRGAAMSDSRTILETADAIARGMNSTRDQALAMLANSTLLKTSPQVADTARVAAFAASERARMMTASIINSSAGAVID
jgi:NAD(P)-dependent dehydrogenase (short-subunit alcohol dehydrogenase family)